MDPFRALPLSSVGHEDSAMLRKTIGQNNGEILGIARSFYDCVAAGTHILVGKIATSLLTSEWSMRHSIVDFRVAASTSELKWCADKAILPRCGKYRPRRDSRSYQAPDLMAAGSLVCSFTHAIPECSISLHRWANAAWPCGLATGRL